MRLALVIALVGLGARGADAEVVEEPAARVDPNRGNFWRDMIDPHADEVSALLHKAQSALDNADRTKPNDLDAAALETRSRVYRDVYNILAYAQRLSPENIAVLALLGRAADETGKTRQAIDAFETITRLQGPDKAGSDVTGRLGLIYLRLGQLDDAVRWLRIAQIPAPGDHTQAASSAVNLATALALRGETAAAVDVLTQAMPASQPSYYSTQQALVPFALAVQLDRDEQRGAAFEVLDKMQSVMAGNFGAQVQNELAAFRFTPIEDEHYYQALLYESVGAYTEARAEWVLYAAGETPYRRRALDHVTLIDSLRHARPGPIQVVPNQPIIHRRIRP